MPPKRTSSASARQKPSPAKQKTSSSHSSSMPRPQPTIASFFSRQTSSSSSQVHPSSPSQQNFQHPTPPQPVPDPDPRPSPSRIGPSNPIAPSDPLSLACRDDVIDLDQTDQIDCDAALARKLAGDDDQSYYDHPKPRNPCLNVSLSPVRPPSLPTPQSTIAAVKPAPGCASAPMISYELDQDVLEFEPSQLDISSWPLASLLPQSPKKERHQDNLGDATTPTRAGARRVPYSFLVAAFLLITQTKSRLTITTVMTNLLRSVIEHDQSSLLSTVYLITNHFGPAYEGIELGIGSQVLSKALKAVSDVSSKQLKTLWNMHGDPGDVAFEARKSVRTLFGSTLSTLTVQSVFDTFSQLAKLKGPGSLDAKTDAIKKLLVAARGEEVRFLIRTACRNLRIGAVKLTVTSALARAFCLTRPPNPQSMAHARAYWIAPESRRGIKAVVPKELTGKAKTAEAEKADRKEVISVLARAERVVREVYVRHPNYDDIIPALLEPGCLEELSKNISLTIGIPISPMLGQITRDLKDVEARLVNKEQEFVAEWKYDGQRVQIHANRGSFDQKRGGKGVVRGGRWVGPQNDIFVRLFSRHLEDMTDKYPDVLELVVCLFERSSDSSHPNMKDAASPPSAQALCSFIIDAEICAVDQVTGQLNSFQKLSNRARKDVKIDQVDVQVGIFAFDLMYLNGQSLLAEPFRVRRNLLHQRLPAHNPTLNNHIQPLPPLVARFGHVNSLESTVQALDEVKQFMLEAIENRCEGIMVKILDHQLLPVNVLNDADEAEDDVTCSDEDEQRCVLMDASGSPGKVTRRKALLASYEPDKRADSWLKVKKDYGELGDSLDLVPIGAWHGQGRKAGWWSPILLALYDGESGGFQAVCKCISGFNDQFYKDLGARYVKGTERCSPEKQLGYIESSGGHVPDVWFLPSEVWEIRGADITLSPVYKAAQGLVDPERGLSLRFPRFYRIREDKAVEDASRPEDFAAMWRRQEATGKTDRITISPHKRTASELD